MASGKREALMGAQYHYPYATGQRCAEIFERIRREQTLKLEARRDDALMYFKINGLDCRIERGPYLAVKDKKTDQECMFNWQSHAWFYPGAGTTGNIRNGQESLAKYCLKEIEKAD